MDGTHEAALARLSKLLDLDPFELNAEYVSFLPLALKEFTNRDVSNFDAWRNALTQPRRAKEGRTPGATLRQVIIRYGAWGFSTSGVERAFSDAQRIAGLSRTQLSMSLTSDEMVLVNSSLTAKEMTEVTIEAQAAWAVVYGDERRGSKTRLDAGKPKPQDAGGKSSETGFIKQRRAAVHELASTRKAVAFDEIQVPDGYWTEKHDKEVKFQTSKARDRELAALEDGGLLDDEVRPDMKDDLLGFQIKRADNHFKREAMASKHSLKPMRKSLHLDGLNVFLATSLDDRQSLECFCRQKGARVVADKAIAELFIIPDVSAPSPQTRCCCILGGHTVADNQFLLSAGKKGCAVEYKRSLKCQRIIYFSDGFLAGHPAMADLILQKMDGAGSNWRLSTSFASDKLRANLFVCFIALSERGHRRFSEVKNKLTLRDALIWLAAVRNATVA
jgi:hypothetical protein